MDLLEQLRTNKGTVSGILSQSLAKEVLNGKIEILEETINLTSFSPNSKKEKNIRSGAAKLIECVAFEKPELIAPYLEKLFPALEVEEPQTRWMIIRTIGLCAKYNTKIAQKAIPFAKRYLKEKREGLLCLASSADLFLGDYGALSKENTKEIFPVLLDSSDNVIMNEHDWLLEAFLKIVKNLSEEEKDMVLSFADEYKFFNRKTTQERVKKLKNACK